MKVCIFLLQKSEIDSFSESGEKPSSVTGTVELNNVFFKYPSRPDVPVSKKILNSPEILVEFLLTQTATE